ncbi:MAG TPA: lipocalin-like domain-containing protein [Longimicrobiales bacterium]|nr:lipocalin-like domain-containing protein [Longimicrobiales bacterium]
MGSRSLARRWCAVGTVLSGVSALALGATAAAAQAPAGARAGVTVDRFLGSWELVEWVATNQQGQKTYPYGEDAQGQITYTADGRMSAHLMQPPENPSDAPLQHLAYWGGFTLQAAAGTVTHHVTGADRPNWIGSDQVRQFRFEGQDVLILSVGGQHLTWRRAG